MLTKPSTPSSAACSRASKRPLIAITTLPGQLHLIFRSNWSGGRPGSSQSNRTTSTGCCPSCSRAPSASCASTTVQSSGADSSAAGSCPFNSCSTSRRADLIPSLSSARRIRTLASATVQKPSPISTFIVGVGSGVAQRQVASLRPGLVASLEDRSGAECDASGEGRYSGAGPCGGQLTLTLVPSPGADHTSSSAPAASARSRMMPSPSCPAPAAAGSKPVPSSSIVRRT